MDKLYLPRKEVRTEINLSENIEFLPIDWYECDVEDIYANRKGYYYNRTHNKKYTIFAFGVNSKGESVCLKINNYCPYFYIQIPDYFNESQIEDLKYALSFEDDSKISSDDLEDLDEEEANMLKFKSNFIKSAIKQDRCVISESQIFWSFMNGQLFKFLKISTISKNSYKFLTRLFKNPVDLDINGIDEPIKYLQFESDLDILLRYFHDRQIKPSDWIKIPKKSYHACGSSQSKCQINISCNWDRVEYLEKTEIPPMIIASFDIEADSSHGDFPLPRKDCKKLANQLVVAWIRDSRILLKENKNSQKYKTAFNSISQKENFFLYRIKQALNICVDNEEYVKDDDIDLIFLKNKSVTSVVETDHFYKTIRLFHHICNRPIVKVKANTEMKKAVNKVMLLNDEEIEKNGYISFDTFLEIIKTVAKNEKLNVVDFNNKILTKEIMVRFVNQELNKTFGYAEGDKVIQIGTVFWRFGESEPFHNNIITLNGCNPFNVGDKKCEVISCRRELDVLLEWSKLIDKYDPDIITGYNIFGFDETFMYDRVIELIGNFNKKKINSSDIKLLKSDDRYNKFMNMTKLSNELLKRVSDASGRLNLKKLASSALGENYLYYFNMPGRVQIDLLKVCQASLTKLPSYKLDSVAEFYISGKIKSFLDDEKYGPSQSTKLIIENIKELEVGNFIIISMLTTGQKLYDGQKLKILELKKEENLIIVDKPIDTSCKPNIPMWGLGKDDVTPQDIFRLQKGNDQDRSIIAKYCIQDCALLIRLLQKLDTIPNNFGMSNVCLVPFSYIFMRGQGIKIFSLVVNECSLNNYKLPVLEKVEPDEEDIEYENKNFNNNKSNEEEIDTEKEDDNTIFQLKNDFNIIKMTDDSYEGAIVLTPKPDIYTEPICVLDFSSLYPSEMIASDLSHDRICEDPYWLGEEGAKRIRKLGYDFIDREYDNYAWIDSKNHNKGKVKNGINIVRFIVNPNEKGLLSKILKKLLGARKATKKKMKTEKDPMKIPILDGLQLAYKVTANSIYGQTGAKTSKIYKQEIAASTTAGGRMRIYTARDYCLKNNPGCDVVYGDSVPGDEPILFQYNRLSLKLIKDAEKNKMGKIFNISNIRVNLNLKNSENNFNYWDTEIKYDRIDSILDMCEEIKKYNDTYILQNSKKYYKPIIKTKIWSSNGFSNIKWVIQHKTNKKIYRIHTTTGIVDVTEDHSLINNNRIVVKPNQVHIGDKLLVNDIQKNIIDKLDIINDIELQQYPELLDILQKNYRTNNNDYLIKLDKTNNYSKSLISKLYWYFKYKLGYNTEIISKEDSYIFYNTNLKVNHGLVTKIEIIDDYEDFVYDIETDDHTFHAGIGNIIVHNTDSVFVKFNLEYEDGSYPETDLDKIQRSIDIGMEIQQKLKDDRTFPEPHDLEYEKVFYPLILITKKRYIGMKYEFEANVGKKTSMGVVTKRRDNAPILKHAFIGVTDTLMKEKNIPKAIEFVRNICYEMIEDKFELNMFVISKTLQEYYKDPESIAHKVLADRMAERDPGNKPACNERIPYVYIKIDEQPGVDYLQGDRIEHINYVRDNKCQIDYETYITNQILKPVSQIFELVVEKLPGYPYHDKYFEELEIQYYNKYNGDLKKTIKKISQLKIKLIKKMIFDEVLNFAHNKINKINTMDNYFKKTENKSKMIEKQDKITEIKDTKQNNVKVKKEKKKKERVITIKKLKQSSINEFFQ